MALHIRRESDAALLARRAANDNDEESLGERAADLVDVPAAVVCLVCGGTDCSGCDEDAQSRSGVVSIVAWERPMLPTFARMWATARSTTRDAEAFFELLPDGPIAPALRFAVLCELVATTSMALVALAALAIVAPSWLRHVASDPGSRALAIQIMGIGIPALSALLVLLHAVHGLFLDWGAARNGGRHARTRALRFGLYACGWDLVMGPFGALVIACKESLTAVAGVLDFARVPSISTHAFLRGCYRLDGDRSRAATWYATMGVGLAVAVAFLIGVAGLLA